MNSVSICVAHYKEDLEWIKNIKYPVQVISKNMYNPEEPPNKGSEASSYLEYIIKNYDNLTNITVFVHGHRNSYHHNENMDEKINRISFNAAYMNINEGPMYGVGPDELILSLLPTFGELLIGEPIKPQSLWFRGSAQFYVHIDLIKRHPKEKYIALHKYLMDSPHHSYYTGRLFEYTWHLLFTGLYVDIDYTNLLNS
jgi:hypothetical protein